MEKTINQIKSSVENIINRLDHLEDRTLDNVDKIFNIENNLDHTKMKLRILNGHFLNYLFIVKVITMDFIHGR